MRSRAEIAVVVVSLLFAAGCAAPLASTADAPRALTVARSSDRAAAYVAMAASPTRALTGVGSDHVDKPVPSAKFSPDSIERCPAEMALVEDRVCVDKWEASLVERMGDGNERPWSPFLSIEGHEASVRAVSSAGVIPQGYISGAQAQRACVASGKRLCLADEWEAACRGPEGTQFPYGNERRTGVCNDDVRKVHPVYEAAGILKMPLQNLWRDGMNESIINQLPNTLLPTGSRAECTNGYGVFDMVGNLHEWVDEIHADKTYVEEARSPQPRGVFRGGYYMDTTKNGDGCSYQTTAHAFTYHDYSTGFRCCQDPERVE